MVGVDEVGRGCLAGPLLVVAARAKNELPSGLRDSKLMTRPQRESIFELLTSNIKFGEGWVSAKEIDHSGLANAIRFGIARALKQLGAQTSDKIILDGPVNYLPKKFKNFECLVAADNLFPIVSAASVYAKVRRDEFMTQIAIRYPTYGFEKHMGYGTIGHFAVLKKLGPLANVHRFSFKGVAL